MVAYRVGAWVPLRTPERDHPERLPAYLAAREELIAQMPAAIAALTDKAAVESVHLADPPDDLLEWFKTRSFMVGTRLIEFLYVEGSAELDEKWLRENADAGDAVSRAVAALNLSDQLERVLVLTELAYPGCIDTLDIALVSDNRHLTSVLGKGAHTRLGFPQTQSWPSIRALELLTVVTWAKRTSFFTRALASSRIERALAAYTHVVGLGWQAGGELLFRAMQGLEAFYIEGTGDLRRQLSSKIQLWLGPWPENRNLIGHLYDLRSAFVHGSSQLAFWNLDGAAWDEDEQHMQQFEKHVDLAVRLLVATLQTCVLRDVTSIEWSYSYATDGVPGNAPWT